MCGIYGINFAAYWLRIPRLTPVAFITSRSTASKNSLLEAWGSTARDRTWAQAGGLGSPLQATAAGPGWKSR